MLVLRRRLVSLEGPTLTSGAIIRVHESGTASAADDSESQTHSRNALERARKDLRGLRVARTYQERTYRAVKPEKAAQQSTQTLERSPFRPLLSPAHIPHSLGAVRLRRVDAIPHRGTSSIAISARYVHPSEDAVLTAMARLGGHNSGHSEKLLDTDSERGSLLTA